MRITVDLPDEVVRTVQLLAVEVRRTFTDLIVEGLALRLDRSTPSRPLPVSSARGGLQPGVAWGDLERASEDHR